MNHEPRHDVIDLCTELGWSWEFHLGHVIIRTANDTEIRGSAPTTNEACEKVMTLLRRVGVAA